jgi:hypothetical protein
VATSNPFAALTFPDFRRLAGDESLSKYERIGFPDGYREGFEEAIFADILAKLSNLGRTGQCVLDIGPGCSDLPVMLMGLCAKQGHRLVQVDSREMLSRLPRQPFAEQVPALYPECPDLIARLKGSVDAVVCYSVFQYIVVESSYLKFLDTTLSLLAPGGQLLIGDVPNMSRRKRFFASEAGIRHHQAFTKSTEVPAVDFNRIEENQVDDSVVFAVLQRARLAGFDAFVVPQGVALPMANRREDILIVRP